MKYSCCYIIHLGCLMGFTMHFYITFGTNLLTQSPVPVSVFFPCFSVSRKRNIKRSPNGMKPSEKLFLERKQYGRLGVHVRKATREARGRGCALHPRGPLVAPSKLPWRLLQVSWIASVPKIILLKVSFRLDSVWYSFSSKHWNRHENNNLGWASS